MSTLGWVFLVALAALVIWSASKGRRQGRKYRSRGTGSRLLRTGMLEMQAFLEPEKRVECLLEEEDRSEQQESGEPSDPSDPKP